LFFRPAQFDLCYPNLSFARAWPSHDNALATTSPVFNLLTKLSSGEVPDLCGLLFHSSCFWSERVGRRFLLRKKPWGSCTKDSQLGCVVFVCFQAACAWIAACSSVSKLLLGSFRQVQNTPLARTWILRSLPGW